MSHTKSSLVRETISTILEIENFGENFEYSEYKEKRFLSSDNVFIFDFGLFLKNDLSFFYDHVLTYLYSIPNSKLNAHVKYKVSIIGVNDLKLYTKEYEWIHDRQKAGQHVANFILRSYLLEPANGFVVNDKLRLLCEVDILNTQTDSILRSDMMSQDFNALLESEKHSDVILTVGEKNFNVHKLILSARSPVFAAMFGNSDTKEAQEGRVEISDMSVEACEQMLRFIYTEQAYHLNLYGLELLVAADKYQLESLKSACEHYLSSKLTDHNVSTILQLASRHQSVDLKVKCIEYINSNRVTQVMASEGWKALIEAGETELVAEILNDLALKIINK